MSFKSKKDKWLGVAIWGILGGLFIISTKESAWIGTFITALTCLLATKIWFGTRYIITDNLLIVGCGLYDTKIPLNEIKTLRKVRNIVSSAALSMDRLEISYGKYDKIWISPEQESEFLKYLIEHSPQMQIID